MEIYEGPEKVLAYANTDYAAALWRVNRAVPGKRRRPFHLYPILIDILF